MDDYELIDKEWKRTCKIILGQEVGELNNYLDWLNEYPIPAMTKPSSISGKPVKMGNAKYCDDAKFMSFDEVDFNKKYDSLTINDIKDIDSIVEAVKERIYYTGEIVLGNSSYITGSTGVTDSNNVFNSTNVINSKDIAFNTNIRDCEGIFGCYWIGASKHLIHSFNVGIMNRGLECYGSAWSSDVYYSAYIDGSSNIMFSLQQKNKHNVIGNLQLEKDKFFKIKAQLKEQLANELMRNKRLPSFEEIIKDSIDKRNVEIDNVEVSDHGNDVEVINKAFSNTTKMILGNDLGDVRDYKNYLNRNNQSIVLKTKSSLTGRDLYVNKHPNKIMNPENVILTFNESKALSDKYSLDESEVQSFESLKNNMGKIGFLTTELYIGNMQNVINTPQAGGDASLGQTSMNTYEVAGAYMGVADSAFSYWPRNSRYTYGVSNIHLSKFCINSYNSKKLTRCFEVDVSNNCSDLYFGHNCENVHDSMFCFNSKNLRNAIGNARLTLPEYKRIKVNIIKQIADELETNKTLKWDVYNVGCVRN